MSIVTKSIISPNYDKRSKGATPQYIVIHYTEVDEKESMHLLTSETAKVSAHYIISEIGQVTKLVDPLYRAWHAGSSHWAGQESLNDWSIGIELVNDGESKFSDILIESLLKLLKELSEKYDIHPQNIIGHSDIAPNRKIDPGPFFPWHKLASSGYGIWPVTVQQEEGALLHLGDTGQAVLEMQTSLQQLGYKIQLSSVFDKQTSDVIRSFLSHFRGEFLLEKYGIKHYNNLNLYYDFDKMSSSILNNLLTNISNRNIS